MPDRSVDVRVERLRDMRRRDWLACIGWALALILSGDIARLYAPREAVPASSAASLLAVVPTFIVFIAYVLFEVSQAKRHGRAVGGVRDVVVIGGWIGFELLSVALAFLGVGMPF